MAVFCPQCGKENRDGAKFCVSCGSALPVMGTEPQRQTPLPPGISPPTAPQATPTSVPSPPPAQSTYTGAAYQPTPPGQVTYPPGVAQPWVPRAQETKPRARVYVGAAVVILSGILILLSSFMPWARETGYYGGESGTGWELLDTYNELEINPFFNDDLYDKPLFSGLCSLIAGILIAAFGLLLLFIRNKGLAVVTLILAIAALGIAVTNTYSISTIEGMSVGAGIIVFILFSLAGSIGSVVGLS